VVLDEAREIRKSAHMWLLYIDGREEGLANAYSDILMGGRTESDGMPHGSDVGNITCSKGLKLVEKDSEFRWIRLIRDVEKELPEWLLVYLQIRRLHCIYSSRKGWYKPVLVDYAEAMKGKTEKSYGELIAISRDTMSDWWLKLVNDLSIAAAIRGLK